MDRRPNFTHGFSVVVCRSVDGKWLAVKETKGRGWWLPAGGVEGGETFAQAAYRETLEEAGIQIELKGILRIEHSVFPNSVARMRVIFFAMPVDPKQLPKTHPDKESEEARWVTIDELKILSQKPPGLRGSELFEWGSYIENGGLIAPLSFMSREEDPLPPITISPTAIQSVAPAPEEEKTHQRMVDVAQHEEIMHNFVTAIEKNDDLIIRKLILSGLDPNARINTKMWTGLHYAIKCNHEKDVNTKP